MSFYDAFISYSHARDKPVAASLQTILQTLGKPWYRRRALRVFRDDTSLAAAPELWPAIEQALGRSRYLVVLASPQLAASHWCGLEVGYWLEHRGVDTLLVALTDGELAWDRAAGDFDWSAATPLPPSLKGRFRGEPKWIDLRGHRAKPDARDASLIDAGADLAAAIHGLPKDDLLSQEVRQQKRALRLAWTGAAALTLLTAGAGWQWWQAETARKLATLQQQRAESERDRAQRNYWTAKEAVDRALFDMVQRVRKAQGMQAQDVRELLEVVRAMMDDVAKGDPDDPHMRRSRAALLAEFASVYMDIGDLEQALQAAEQSVAVIRALHALRPENSVWHTDLGTSLERLGDVLVAMARLPAALATFEECLAVRREVAQLLPHWRDGERLVSFTLARIGEVHIAAGEAKRAAEAFEEGTALMRNLVAAVPEDPGFREALSMRLFGLGSAREALQEHAAALAAYQESLAVARALPPAPAGNTTRPSGIALRLERIGNAQLALGEKSAALAVFEEALAIRRGLLAAEPASPRWALQVAVSLYKIALVAPPVRGRAALREAIPIVDGLAQGGHLTKDQQTWPRLFREALAALPAEEADEALPSGPALRRNLDLDLHLRSGERADAEQR